MADLQTQFNKFHEAIKIDFDGNKPLRDKRDIILNALRAGLKKKYPTNTPTFDSFNQGSYDLGTGVEPLGSDDYDIDVGIVFNIAKANNDPLAVKQLVFEILDAAYSRKVKIRRPCVRVQYHQAGEKAYHVDLAIYARGKSFLGDLNGDLYIAKGKPELPTEKLWEVSEPYRLKELIKSRISDDADREQFRRVIRYLKRWKSFNSYLVGNGKPTGIALTACCYNHFTIEKDYLYGQNSYKYNDLRALQKIVDSIIGMYSWSNKIEVKLPVEPYNNLFIKMSEAQMLTLKKQLEVLKSTLNNASTDTQTTMACMRLRGVFGDFPTL